MNGKKEQIRPDIPHKCNGRSVTMFHWPLTAVRSGVRTEEQNRITPIKYVILILFFVDKKYPRTKNKIIKSKTKLLFKIHSSDMNSII